MPIKGLTDRGLAFPEIGQVRKGAKKTANQPGADLTYFRVEFSEFEKETEAKFRAKYGDKPQEINIVLPFNEIERMWDAWMEAYTAGRLVARSDNEFITYQLDETGEIIVRNGLDKNGQKVHHPANNIAGYDYQKKPVYFKASGRLKVIIPELARAAYVTVMTTSLNDIANISAQLDAFKTLNNGQIAGIPFVLRRRPKMVSTPKSTTEPNQKVRRQKWLISIEADPVWVSAKLGQIKTLAAPDFDESLLLPETSSAAHQGEFEEDFDEDEIEGDVSDQLQGSETEPPSQPTQLEDLEYETAAAAVTAQGARFDTLTRKQLEYLVTNGSIHGKEAAKIVLARKFGSTTSDPA